ncbi:unnamed protein product [Ophioblennius macclurei]
MEGQKERQLLQVEEKESNEAEEDARSDESDADNEEEEEEEEDCEGAALVWQEGYGEDNLGLPIMHWEALSLRIAELEKQEEEKKEKMAKSATSLEKSLVPLTRAEDRRKRSESWEDGDEACNSHVLALTSRLQTQMNLQLCFINNSESEEEEEKTETGKQDVNRRGAAQDQKCPPPSTKPEKSRSRGFRNALRNLRDRLRADHKTMAAPRSHLSLPWTHLELSDLQNYSTNDLMALCASLSKNIQDLSSELVGRLQVRDQLRTEQDAMLLEVQDLTSL